MRKLELEHKYVLDLTDKIQLGPIKRQVLYERLTDARISGLLVEDLADAIYNNVTKSPSPASSYDLMDDDGNKYESRIVNMRGASLIPANQVGSGRRYNRENHLAKLASLYAYLFVDVRSSPVFSIVAFPVGILGERKRITTIRFDELVKPIPVTNI